MDVRWDQGHTIYRGWTADGHQVAEVASLVGPRGEDRGWMVWLPQKQVELFARYPTAEAAMAAAETALRGVE